MSDPVRINRADWLAALTNLGLNLDEALDITITDSARGGHISIRRIRRDHTGRPIAGATVTTTIGIQSAAEMIHPEDLV